MSELRAPLRGISEPLLDRTYPGWQQDFITGHVDHVDLTAEPARVVGWAFSPASPQPLHFALRDGSGREWKDLTVAAVPRPDVTADHPIAPEHCGFAIDLPDELRGHLRELVVLVRPPQSTLWFALPMIQVKTLS